MEHEPLTPPPLPPVGPRRRRDQVTYARPPFYRGSSVSGPAPRRSLIFPVILAALALVAFIVGLIVVGVVGVYIVLAASLPSADELQASHLEQSTKIYDKNGGLLSEVFDPQGGRRTNITPDKIPNDLKQATIATEDQSFYTNPGVDWRGITRAVYYDWRYHKIVTGGSTITQQLVKNMLLTPEPTFQRKIREAMLALEVTRRYPKDQILAMYLNSNYYGNLSYGVQAASQSYFHKDVDKLDLAEASLLAGLPQSPATYDPCSNPEAALTRQREVLTLMASQGFVDSKAIEAASSEMSTRLQDPSFASQSCTFKENPTAPHFVDYVREQLEEQYGTAVVYKGGLQVYTSFDPTIQKIVQDEAKKQVAALKGHNVSSAAVVVANPQTGEILAMLGSVDFFDKSIDGQVNVATSLRQPGSSIKPVNYVTAFEKGWTPATPILDISTTFPGYPAYTPVDYDGKEHGIVNPRVALGNSLNIPAVKTLYFVTVPGMIATAQELGINTFTDPSRYGLALTLGGGEVKLVELTGAYAVFANAGKRAPLTPYHKIVDAQGQTVFDVSQQSSQQVLDPRYAYLITNILSDNNARTMEFGANSPLKTSRPSFAKTGTTTDFRDNWTLGGTPDLVIGVWVGNPRNEAMQDVTGISGAAPIWHNVLERVYAEDDQFKAIAPHDFPAPQGLVSATVCNESGMVPTALCPPDHRHNEIFLSEQAPHSQDNVWVRVKIDKTNNLLANDRCPAAIVEEKVFEKMPQDPVLPYEKVVAWANAHGIPQPPLQQSPCTGTGTPGTGTPGTGTPSSTPGGATGTPVPLLMTATLPSAPTDTPVAAPTNTAPAAPTNTTAPLATNTAAPPATNTSAPLPTNTPAPAATNTPAPAPTNTTAAQPTNPPAPTNTSAAAPTNQPAPTNPPAPTKTP